jgi:hypothetical protein
MASTATTPAHSVATETDVVNAVAALKTDIANLQSGNSVALVSQAGGSTITLTSASSGKITNLDTAAGTTVTLPAATGTGNIYRFIVTVLATSNSHKIQVASGTDFFIGILSELSDDSPPTVKGWAAANSGTVSTNSDTITLNRSTTGSTIVGEWIEVCDVTTATWHVKGLVAGTGTEATPFSAAV